MELWLFAEKLFWTVLNVASFAVAGRSRLIQQGTRFLLRGLVGYTFRIVSSISIDSRENYDYIVSERKQPKMTKRDAFNELLSTGVGYARAVRIRVLADLEKHEFVVREDYLPEIWRANGSSRSARDYSKKLNVVTKIFKQLNREGILREEIYAKSHDGPRITWLHRLYWKTLKKLFSKIHLWCWVAPTLYVKCYISDKKRKEQTK